MTRHHMTGVALFLGVTFVCVGAFAQTPSGATVKVVSGTEVRIDSGEGIAIVTAPKAGATRVVADAGGKTSTLFYTPKDTTAAGKDSLTYKTTTQAERTVAIEIAPKLKEPASTTDPGNRNPQSGFSEATYGEAFKALFLLFVLAVLLESALAILFNWRPFVEVFNARAVRPIVSLGVALLFVFHFDLDLVSSMVNLIRETQNAFPVAGPILTAMVIAGGSSGVNNLMVALGFRQVRTPETAVPKPAAKQGWLSVSIVRHQAAGPVSVSIGVKDANNKTPFVAVVNESTRRGYRYFFRDKGRFPGSGGYPVAAGSDVTVEVTAETANPNAPLAKTWGPNIIADGAIIDLTFEM